MVSCMGEGFAFASTVHFSSASFNSVSFYNVPVALSCLSRIAFYLTIFFVCPCTFIFHDKILYLELN